MKLSYQRIEEEGNRMIFDDQNKVIIDSMNTIEARAFVKFLLSEIARHEMDIDNARTLILNVAAKFKLGDIK